MQLEVKRGEIYWVNWSPGRGSEQGGLRPALIVQNDTGNRVGRTTIVASITTVIKTYPLMVRCSPRESGLDRESVIDLASIMTIEKSRLGQKCGRLTAAKMDQVNQAIKDSMGLEELAIES